MISYVRFIQRCRNNLLSTDILRSNCGSVLLSPIKNPILRHPPSASFSSSLSPYLFQTSTSYCHSSCCCNEHSQGILWPHFPYILCTDQCNSVTLLILWYEALPSATQLDYACLCTYCAHISCDSTPPHHGNTAHFILNTF